MPTLTTYRARCAHEFGLFATGTATSGSTTSVLEATGWPFKSTIGQSDLYRDCFLFRPNAVAAGDKVRVIDTYTPTSGLLTPDAVYTNGASTETFEIHGVIEPLTALTRLINQGLKRLYYPVEFTLTPVANQQRHSLATAASWLTDPLWVYQVGYLGSGDDRNQLNPFELRPVRGWADTPDGTTVYINHPGRAFSTTDTLYVLAVRPAYNLCAASAGAYGSQNGLSLEGDKAPPDEEWVAAATLVEAWREYGQVLEQSANARLRYNRAEAAAWLTHETRNRFREPARTFRPLRSFGPRQAIGGQIVVY